MKSLPLGSHLPPEALQNDWPDARQTPESEVQTFWSAWNLPSSAKQSPRRAPLSPVRQFTLVPEGKIPIVLLAAGGAVVVGGGGA